MAVSARWKESTTGWIGITVCVTPVRLASSAASSTDPADEWIDGIATVCTCSAPRASTAIAATSAESMPPDRPSTTEVNPFLRT